MTKVIIEIDEKGWVLKAQTVEGEFIETGIINETGATHKGNLDDLENVDEDLHEAISSGFYLYDVARVLNEKI
ncbi:hypothetical protein MHI22_05345 [Lysinibacillus sp. FSL L8-0312]|uniref:hypothetical protein n=1 Tax=Lysinibacillus sp. FSL L8-0312 TaxID=2921521 RepID=UPI0030F98181